MGWKRKLPYRGQRRIEPGLLELWVGGGQPGTRQGLAQAPAAKGEFRITGTKELPR